MHLIEKIVIFVSMTDVQLYTKLLALHKELKKEVSDFIDSLKSQINNSNGSKKRSSGLAHGLIKMKDNFDDPIDEFKEYI